MRLRSATPWLTRLRLALDARRRAPLSRLQSVRESLTTLLTVCTWSIVAARSSRAARRARRARRAFAWLFALHSLIPNPIRLPLVDVHRGLTF